MLPDKNKMRHAAKELLIKEYEITRIQLASDINYKQSVELMRYQEALYAEIKRRRIKLR